MQTRHKKILCILLVVALFCSVFTIPAGAVPVDGPAADSEFFYLYDSLGWGAAYLYALSEDDTELCGEWPGTPITETTTDEYGETQFICCIPDGAVSIVINNGYDERTVEICNFESFVRYWLTGEKDTDGYYLVRDWCEHEIDPTPETIPLTLNGSIELSVFSDRYYYFSYTPDHDVFTVFYVDGCSSVSTTLFDQAKEHYAYGNISSKIYYQLKSGKTYNYSFILSADTESDPEETTVSVHLDEVTLSDEGSVITLNEEKAVSLSDRDSTQLFRFTAPETAQYTFSSDFKDPIIDLTIDSEVFDADMDPVPLRRGYESTDSDNDIHKRDCYTLEAGEEYLLIINAFPVYGGSFSVSGTLNAAYTGVITIGDDEPELITERETKAVSLQIGENESRKVFRFVPRYDDDYVGKILAFDAEEGAQTLPVDCNIYNSDFHLIFSDIPRTYREDGVFTFDTYRLTAGETYYIAVGLSVFAESDLDCSMYVNAESMEHDSVAFVDEATGISVTPEDVSYFDCAGVTLSVTEITDPDQLINLAEVYLNEDDDLLAAYSILLYKDGEPYDPPHGVSVLIPDIPASANYVTTTGDGCASFFTDKDHVLHCSLDELGELLISHKTYAPAAVDEVTADTHDDNIRVQVTPLTDGEALEHATAFLGCEENNETLYRLYDVEFVDLEGTPVRPETDVDFFIYCTDEQAKVYYIDFENDSVWDMGADYRNDYLCFTSWYDGYYAVVTPDSVVDPGTDPIPGDTDGNGDVEITDATYIQRWLANLPINESILQTLMNGDVDQDGELTIKDVTFIQRWLANLSVPYPIGIPSITWIWPTPDNYNLTAVFGEVRSHETHNAVDIGAEMGTPVYAANEGTVVSANNSCTHNWGKANKDVCSCGGGYGNYVWILHDNGYETIYAHLTGTAVNIGDHVSAGQLIGYVGSTGWSTGPHLHFELRIDGVKSNPMELY